MRKWLDRKLERFEYRTLGYKVNRKQQISNILTLVSSIAIVMLSVLYLDYMPLMVSVLIVRY